MTSSQIETVRAMAPGKVILLGEHAVVYGRTALAAAIDRHVTVRMVRDEREERASRASVRAVSESFETASTVHPEALEGCALNDPRLADALVRAADVVALPPNGLVATISTNLPIAMGLGSSAALSVALIRALAQVAQRRLDDAAVCAGAFEIEKIFHGFPSGIDNTVATYGGLITFTRGAAARPLHAHRPLPLVVALGRAPRRTQHTVSTLRRTWETHPEKCEPLFDEIAALVSEAQHAIATGNLATLGAAMSANHAVLQRLAISTDELDEMVSLARTQGALGAKLTGGGGGGAVICLCESDRAGLIAAFTRAGWQAFATDIGASQRGAHAGDSTGYVDQYSAALA